MNLKKITAYVLCLIVGIVVGFYFSKTKFSTSSITNGIDGKSGQIRSESGVFTNPLLDCNLAQGVIDAPKINFSKELTDFVNLEKQKPNIENVGVYFRDLDNGPVFGVNSSDQFIPASLLKLPLMIAYYDWNEDEPGVLDKKLEFKASEQITNVKQTVLPEQQIVVGKKYSVSDLINRMIKYSDNQSLMVLFDNIQPSRQRDLYTTLGIDTSAINDPTKTISVTEYSSFFRILFNASYLSRNYSEKALSLLTETTFNDGLRVGVPNNIPIAHKFGERTIDSDSNQFHDCGIVYYPKHPYLLCIMTSGTDDSALKGVIADISKFVYGKVDSQYSQ